MKSLRIYQIAGGIVIALYLLVQLTQAAKGGLE